MKKKIAVFLPILFFVSFSFAFAQDAGKKLLELREQLKGQYKEMDGYLNVLLMGMLAEQHVLAFGGPGGSKTRTAKDTASEMLGRLFTLQFTPSTREELLKGAMVAEKYLKEGIAEFKTEQSLL